jgi:hypothetical protein
LLSQRLTDFCCCHVISSLVLKESNCKDSAQADGPAQGLPKRADEFLPFVTGKMSAGSAKILKANYRGVASIQNHGRFLSVIKLTRKDSNLTCCHFPERHVRLDYQTSESSLTHLTTETNNTCFLYCQRCLLNNSTLSAKL